MIERLAWDSDFFGYEVGRARIAPDAFSIENLQVEGSGFDLIYVLSSDPLPGLALVDAKVVLDREIPKSPSAPRIPVDRFHGKANDQLKQLALESGILSRFRVDPDFHNGEFERLYLRWLENSLERPGEVVLVTQDELGLTGFVSLAHGDASSSIGLIAVDARARGKGVGSALLDASFVAVREAGNQRITGVTQEENKAAMALYASAGFQVIERTCIHHYRPKKG